MNSKYSPITSCDPSPLRAYQQAPIVCARGAATLSDHTKGRGSDFGEKKSQQYCALACLGNDHRNIIIFCRQSWGSNGL